jgi:hypothetical protein
LLGRRQTKGAATTDIHRLLSVTLLPECELVREPIRAVFASKRHMNARARMFLDRAGQGLD